MVCQPGDLTHAYSRPRPGLRYSFFCSCIQAVCQDSRLVGKIQRLHACGAAGTIFTACFRLCCSLCVATYTCGKRCLVLASSVQSKNVGSCVNKQHRGRLRQHGKVYSGMNKFLQLCDKPFKQAASPVWSRSLNLGFHRARLTLCVVAVWLLGPQVAGEGHQARKHGYGDVLRKFSPATAPQHCSRQCRSSCKSAAHFGVRRQP